jgi:hypothetical protein
VDSARWIQTTDRGKYSDECLVKPYFWGCRSNNYRQGKGLFVRQSKKISLTRHKEASMSNSKSDELLWRETYFILFSHTRRPTLSQVEDALLQTGGRLLLENLAADDDGLFASLLVESPEDHAAVEVSYETGESVIEQNLEWAKGLQDQLSPEQLLQLVEADARLDVAHFERKPATKTAAAKSEELDDPFFSDEYADDEGPMEMLDPTCLLTVVEALATLTEGVTYDPASGQVLS